MPDRLSEGRQPRRREIRKEKKLEKIVQLRKKLEPVIPKVPMVQSLPNSEKMIRLEKELEDLRVPKQPKETENISMRDLLMTWCARKADREGQWSWGEPRDWDEEENQFILRGLNGLEGKQWYEILSLAAGNGRRMHHGHQVTELHDDAVERWIELELDQFDEIFRFRLGNMKRAWGIVLQGHFYMVWWERRHMIYPVEY